MAEDANGIAASARGGPGHEPLEGGGDLRPRRGHDHPLRAHRLAALDGEREARRRSATREDGGLRPDPLPLEPHHERVHHLAQPPAQRVEGGGRLRPGRRLRARAPPTSRGRGCRACASRSRKRGKVARIESRSGSPAWMPGQQRLAEPLDRLLPEAAPQEGRDRLVPASVPARDHEVEAHAELAGPGEQAARGRRAGSSSAPPASSPREAGGASAGGGRRPSAGRGSWARGARRGRARGRARCPPASARASSRGRPRAGSRPASRSGSPRRGSARPRAGGRGPGACGGRRRPTAPRCRRR